MINNSNCMPEVPSQSPKNHARQPIPENPISEKIIHNTETTSSIDLKKKKKDPTSEHLNHPTVIFSEFMDKEWGDGE